MIDLDQAIDQSYREASETEASARRLEARIEQIPGAKRVAPQQEIWNSRELQSDPRKSHRGLADFTL